MLSSKYRLKRKRDFERVYKKGRASRESFLLLRFAPNDLDNDRFGIVISKKVAKKANERNIIKRRIREIIKKILPEIKNNLDVVIIGLSGIKKETDFQEIEQSIRKLFFKANILIQERNKEIE